MSIIAQMGSLLLRSTPPPPSYDPDAQAIIDRMIPEPSTALKERLNTFVVGLKNPALWSASGAMWYRLDSLFVPATAQNEQSGLLDWRRNVSAEKFGAADWSASLGFAGDSAAGLSYFDSKYTPSIDSVNATLNSTSIGFIVTRGNSVADRIIYFTGATKSVNPQGELSIGKQGNTTADGAFTVSIHAAGNSFGTTSTSAAAGDIVTANRNGDSVVAMQNGAHVGTAATRAPVALCDRSIHILRRNTGSATASNTDAAFGLYWIADAITTAEQSMLKSLYDAYVAAA